MKYNKAKTIMVQGTGSGVGKSVIVSALCRIFARDGYSVAPYKAQNMALNSFVTPSGGEIGRAQAAQAQAARVVPTVDMNPVLIKPSTDIRAQVIVLGKPLGNKTALQYNGFKRTLFGTAKRSLANLRKEHEIVVMEGAGSPAEVNLRKNDIVNMSIALASRTPVILVGDIDKGGVLAWITGTLGLLNKSERKLVKGIIINKFRGDIKLFEDGVRFLERKTGVKVLGVLPYFRGINIPEEDSVPLEAKQLSVNGGKGIKIAVIYLPHISNFTDYDALEQEPGVTLSYVSRPRELDGADAVIIPGTKNTISDLNWLRKAGLARKILEIAAANNSPVVGICGGYQMLGTEILDIKHIESKKGSARGLGLLQVKTSLGEHKHLRQVTAESVPGGLEVKGYEIHHGNTVRNGGCRPLFKIDRAGLAAGDRFDGAIAKDGLAWGTYLHGVFDSGAFRENFLNGLRKRRGLKPRKAQKYDVDIEFDKLADIVRKHIDIKAIYGILKS